MDAAKIGKIIERLLGFFQTFGKLHDTINFKKGD